jgi:hypothetical protein
MVDIGDDQGMIHSAADIVVDIRKHLVKGATVSQPG